MTYRTDAKTFASRFCTRFTTIMLLWTTLNWTLPATPDHPDSTSTRSGSWQLGRTPSCSRSWRGPYWNGTPCQPIPSVLTLLPPLRVSCPLPLSEQPLPVPVLATCGTWKLSYRSRSYCMFRGFLGAGLVGPRYPYLIWFILCKRQGKSLCLIFILGQCSLYQCCG